MQVMGELAPIYALDLEQALVAGLLHDAAKDLPEDAIERIVREAPVAIPTPEDRDYVYYLHGPVGAYFVRRELGITDPLVLDAIYTHTFTGDGPNYHAPLAWCLRFSDILEPGRDWSVSPWLRDGAPRLRSIVFAGRMEEGAFLHAGLIIRWFDATGKPVHANLRRIYRELGEKLGLDDQFLEKE
jgi:predicted HD superfamily hydrolase involved in NAD metabolism